jgi:hypothetical protein
METQTNFGQIRDLLSEAQLNAILDAAEARAKELLKDAKFDNDNSRKTAIDAKAGEILFGGLQKVLDEHKTFLHLTKLGWWGDKFVSAAMNAIVLFGGIAVASYISKPSQKSDAEKDAAPAGEANPFKTKATDRPIRPSRELVA